jgi:hypothetical protein
VTTIDSDDDDTVAHYADKADIVRAHVTGEPITALCGKVWTPTRTPDGLPVCSRCVSVLEQIKNRDRGRRGFN